MARLAAGEDVIRIDDVDTDSYTSWTENRLRLNETTLSELEARIHEIYGLNFHWTGSADSPEGIKISGSLPTDNLIPSGESAEPDRKSTRLHSSHVATSSAVLCV